MNLPSIVKIETPASTGDIIFQWHNATESLVLLVPLAPELSSLDILDTGFFVNVAQN